VVHSLLVEAPAELRQGIGHKVSALVGGAAPSLALVEGMARIGIDLTHIYGLTEVYGPASICAKHEEWQLLDVGQQAERNGRQGVRCLLQEGCTVLDPQTLEAQPRDGKTIGEIMYRGNLTMKGYLKNEQATDEVFRGGWFHSGDLAVLEPDGYAKIKDRSKDIIISGGENISSLEVEDTLYRHPSVLVAAVVAEDDEKWGETPCAFIELRPGTSATESEIIAHCRARLAHFKAPKHVIFGPVPRTSTGKIQKFVLRERLKTVR
jgi:fatty-acyl-CoA synthase